MTLFLLYKYNTCMLVIEDIVFVLQHVEAGHDTTELPAEPQGQETLIPVC